MRVALDGVGEPLIAIGKVRDGSLPCPHNFIANDASAAELLCGFFGGRCLRVNPAKGLAEGGVGDSSLAEQRVVKTLSHGKTEFLKSGDRVRTEMLDAQGASIVGAIEQEVEAK